MKLTMEVDEKKYAVCKFKQDAKIPTWLLQEEFVSITRTKEELSIVCDQELIGDYIDEIGKVEIYKDWRCLKVVGPLDFSLVGILAGVADALAKAMVSIFAISTFDTDYIFVRNEMLEKAILALKSIEISI